MSLVLSDVFICFTIKAELHVTRFLCSLPSLPSLPSYAVRHNLYSQIIHKMDLYVRLNRLTVKNSILKSRSVSYHSPCKIKYRYIVPKK